MSIIGVLMSRRTAIPLVKDVSGAIHVWNVGDVGTPSPDHVYRLLITWPETAERFEVNAEWRLDPANAFHKSYFLFMLFNDEHQLELKDATWRAL